MKVTRYSWPEKLILAAEAFIAMAVARMALHRTKPADILRRNFEVGARVWEKVEKPEGPIAKVAFIIPQMAQRLPWRSDCLVQALAAQAMLQRRQIASQIIVGTTKHPDGRFEAHAWLRSGSKTIIGGDVARFEPLLGSMQSPVAPR
ncbi:lasso peptide biosynthesis B2 protein [Erythrobacter sp. R86502]|uniref:lasso peptide biosynthesis B2 protein n=1 Tax=Erythrobacter sp. R86502 TaxID=3093846 RepID=UPI0036D28C18